MKYKENVMVWSRQPRKTYSGGRYHVCILTKALASAGYNVYFITNCVPRFFYEIIEPQEAKKIFPIVCLDKKNQSEDLTFLPKTAVASFIIPGGYGNYSFPIEYSKKIESKILFLNFESGNWFNSYSPIKRHLKFWKSWREPARESDIILSSTQEGSNFAKEFFNDNPETHFESCYPALNSELLKKIPNQKRKKQILIFLSIARDTGHKGGAYLASFLQESMRGYTLLIIRGKGDFPSYLLEQLNIRSRQFGIQVIMKNFVSDEEKYILLKESELLLFPSLFEGYGYPPIEALNCGCHVIAFDLPVLKETCSNSIIYAKHGDWNDFKLKIKKYLTGEIVAPQIDENVKSIAQVETMGLKLKEILERKRERKKTSLFKELLTRRKKNNTSLQGVDESTLVYPMCTSINEAENLTTLLKKFTKKRKKILIGLENNIKGDLPQHQRFSFIEKKKDYYDLLNKSTEILYWKPSYNTHELDNSTNKKQIRINIFESNISFGNDSIESFWKANVGSFDEKTHSATQRNNYHKLLTQLKNKNITDAVYMKGKSPSLPTLEKDKEALIVDENIFLNLEILETLEPQIIYITSFENLYHLGDFTETIEAIKTYLTGDKETFMIMEYFDNFPLALLLPTRSKRMIFIQKTPHTIPWSINHSFRIPSFLKEPDEVLKLILSGLFRKLKIVTLEKDATQENFKDYQNNTQPDSGLTLG